MSDLEKEIRAKICREIADKFGLLAPYSLVVKFVRTGP